MTMTLLETVREFTERRGLDVPNAVMGSTDDSIRQLRALANEVITDITNRGESWPRLQKQATFTTTGVELQGAISTIAPYGFKYLILDTIYDRTSSRSLFGPRNAPAWQRNQALPQAGPFYSYRIWQGNLYLQPAPGTGLECAFEYASDMAILGNDGSWKKRFDADTDSFALDEDLLLAGLNWKWRREKGLSYAQEKSDYEALVSQSIGTQATKGDVNMGTDSSGGIPPGIFVPSGNWPVA